MPPATTLRVPATASGRRCIARASPPRQLHPSQQHELLKAGYGVVNLVNRATATAAELAPEEFVAGRKRLAAKIRRYRPKAIAFLGVGAYCHAFGLRNASIGLQPESFEGAKVWVLPNPSGLNANYQLPELVKLFRAVARMIFQGRFGRCRQPRAVWQVE